MQRSLPRRLARGVSLFESCLVLGIGAVLVGLALPSLQQLRQRQLLHATAEALGADLRLARAEAVRLNVPIQFRISGKGAAGCYLLSVGPRQGCECKEGATRCTLAGASVLKVAWLPARPPLSLSSNVDNLEFQPSQGTVTPTGSIDLRLGDQEGIRQKVAITGRVQSCYLTTKVAGLRPC